MTSFNVNNDDAGLHIRPATGRAVTEVQPYPGAPAAEKNEDTSQTPKQAPQQSPDKEKRRKADRRHQQIQVLLDTRSGHDRRNTANELNATGENDANETGSASGINVYT